MWKANRDKPMLHYNYMKSCRQRRVRARVTVSHPTEQVFQGAASPRQAAEPVQ